MHAESGPVDGAPASSCRRRPNTRRPRAIVTTLHAPKLVLHQSTRPLFKQTRNLFCINWDRGDNDRVKRLNGMDAMLLYSETPNLHTHTLKVAVVDAADYDGEFTFDVLRRTVLRRLHRLDPLRYKLVDIPWRLHHPMWMENCEVDLDYHLRRVQVPAPGGRRELDRVIGEVASTPLDRHHPLWEFHFADGLAGGRCALIGKVHHALADGVASANLLARAMDPDGSFSSES